MSAQRPEYRRPFAVALGALPGLAGFLATPPPWPTAPLLSLAVGVGVAVLGWRIAERMPDALDRIVESRAHWLFVALGLVPVAGFYAPVLVGGPKPSDATGLRLVCFAIGTVVVAETGKSRRGAILLSRGTVRASVTVERSRVREILFSVVASATVVAPLSVMLGSETPIGAVAGTALGTTVGSALTEPRTLELAALDHHLLRQRGEWASGIPWRRVRDVSVDGDTLRIALGLPYPTVYTADLSTVDDRRAVVRAFRAHSSCR